MFILNTGELALLIEALERAASRHESMARAANNVANANSHDGVAAAMRKLHTKLMKRKFEIAAPGSGAA
ncbi:MAG TPA: hypothetical protein VKE42_12270 [Candidatus Cybelea sp.]|nr:hypothetical protein [Candidatus Cybelea sp.]